MKFIRIFIRFDSLGFSSLFRDSSRPGRFRATEEVRGQDACKTALDEESLRPCSEKNDGSSAHCRVSVFERVRVCVRVRV